MGTAHSNSRIPALAGRTAVVTGGGTGIGRGITVALAAAGMTAQVMVTSRAERARQICDGLESGRPPLPVGKVLKKDIRASYWIEADREI